MFCPDDEAFPAVSLGIIVGKLINKNNIFNNNLLFPKNKMFDVNCRKDSLD